MSYIETSDISANIADGFDLESLIEESDLEVRDLAERLGVRTYTDISTPVHYKIKRYAVVYVLMRLCQDKAGTNNTEIIDTEKYMGLYAMYRRELEDLRGQISIEMVTGVVNEMRDRAIQTGIIFVG